jgi:sensor histidine kinase YesM
MGTGTFIYHLNGAWEELTDEGEHILSNSLSYKNGIVWASTVSSGIYGIIDKKIKYRFNTKNILSENKTRIVKASGEFIWLNTDKNLYAINYKTNAYSKYGVYQSISPKDINNIELYKNTIYLATNKGLFFFPDKMVWKNNIIPNIKITFVTLNDSILNFKKNLELLYTNTNLKINFSGVALKSKQDFSYQYRLIGLDSNWIKVSPTTPYVLFSQVPSGNFVFQLKLINENGVQSKTATLYIFVSTPFWQQLWFYLIVIIMVAGFVALLFIKRISHIKRRSELRNKVTASQLTALKSQMNPHFLFNTLNSLQDLILKHDIKNSNFYLNKFSHLMRDVLEVSGKDEIILSKEIKMLDTYLELEKLRFGEEFTFTIKTSENLDLDHLVLPPMIIQPFIENSIKHGLLHKKGIKLIEVDFKMEDILICTILDNGIGRKKSEEIKNRSGRIHQSFATEATEKRIELLNTFNNKKYSFEIIDMDINNISNGTKVIIKIPI